MLGNLSKVYLRSLVISRQLPQLLRRYYLPVVRSVSSIILLLRV